MDQTTHEFRLANWKAIIEQCQVRPKDQTAKDWMAENDISDKQYYYWLRRVRTVAIRMIQFQSCLNRRNSYRLYPLLRSR